jgi:hypothetical protein
MAWTAGTVDISTKAHFKLFRMCVCGLNDCDEFTWVPHLLNEIRPLVQTPHQLIDLFASTLLLGTRMFLASIRMSQESTNSTTTLPPPWSFAGYHDAKHHLEEELGLPDTDFVEPLLEQMIEYLERLLSKRQGITALQPTLTIDNHILERSRLSSKSLTLLAMYMDLGNSDPPSVYLTFDKYGDDLWVCHDHYLCLNPGFQRNHVRSTIKRFGSYDAATGKIDVHLQTRKDLAILCKIDIYKASRVTELNVALDWRLSTVELK